MSFNIRHIGLVLLCMLVTTATFAQTKKVVRQTKQATITQKSTMAVAVVW